MRLLHHAAAAVFALSLASCGSQESVADAEARVTAFHVALDQEQYDSIWKTSDAQMRKATSQADMSKFLGAVHRKLGGVKSTKQVAWRVNATTGGTFVVLNMSTEFEKGPAQEAFVFVRDGKDLKLQTYNINSPALIVN